MAPKLRIELYADGADVRDMVAARESGLVKGFTTNPTLMRKSGISDYEAFAREALNAVSGMPIVKESEMKGDWTGPIPIAANQRSVSLSANLLDTSVRPTPWLGISDSNFDVRREYSCPVDRRLRVNMRFLAASRKASKALQQAFRSFHLESCGTAQAEVGLNGVQHQSASGQGCAISFNRLTSALA